MKHITRLNKPDRVKSPRFLSWLETYSRTEPTQKLLYLLYRIISDKISLLFSDEDQVFIQPVSRVIVLSPLNFTLINHSTKPSYEA
ncbi:MAG: hypothetical protein H7096_10050 [Flavobacterium sp.]|nr:hypothetical protein [Pedobacter sp.]